MALVAYRAAVRRLLHDSSGAFWSDAELTDYINQARRRIALDSGSIRGLFTFYLSADQESYPFQGAIASITVTAGGSGYTSAPTVSFSGGGGSGATATASISSGAVTSVTLTANGTSFTSAPTVSFSGGGGSGASATASILNAFDILNISVNWGNSWITLAYVPFSEFQAKARFYRNMRGQPAVWSKGPAPDTSGGDYFYIFQIPSSSYAADIDAVLQPADLIDDTTPEALRYPFTDCVAYYAAYLAKYKQQEINEALAFLRIYDELMRRGISSSFQRRIPNPYGTR